MNDQTKGQEVQEQGRLVDRLLTDQQLSKTRQFEFVSREAAEFQPTEGELDLSVSTSMVIWSAQKASKPILRGGYMSIVVTEQLEGVDFGHLRIIDQGSNLVMPIGPLCPDMPQGFVFANRGHLFHFDLLEGNQGVLSSDIGNLHLSPSGTWTKGKISFASVLWGEESA